MFIGAFCGQWIAGHTPQLRDGRCVKAAAFCAAKIDASTVLVTSFCLFF